MKSIKRNIFIASLVLTCFVSAGTVYAVSVDLGIPSGANADLFGEPAATPMLNTVGNTTPLEDVTNINNQVVADPNEIVTGFADTPAATPSKMSIAGLVSWLVGLLNYVVRFIILLALIAFLYGILKLVFIDASNETERAKARKFMLWGIVSLFVMVSVWGLVNVLKSTVFGEGALIVPQLK